MTISLHSIEKMNHKRTSYEFGGCYIFFIILLDVTKKTQMSVHDNGHAFIQSNSNDVRLMGVHDGLRVFMHQDISSSGVRISNSFETLNDVDSFSTLTFLKFIPPELDFKERHLGVPHLERVMLLNTDENKTIHMSSISGNTLHFHSSFFQDKTIPPKGNTTFAVVFLGRAEGRVASNLYIHTSEGTFKYKVSGAGVESPYRLRPIGGVRLPLHAAFQSMVHLHNPHHFPIQVMEVYSSGSEFHLELPGGEMEGPKTLWEVPPYATKPVIKATFQANSQSNHTAYIRMKLNNTEEVLVIPLEVEVTSQPGLYSPQHHIDFGLGGSRDRPKKIKLYLCNSLKKSLRIQSVMAVPVTAALHVRFEPLKISPGPNPVQVAELTFDWKNGFETKHTSGKLFIKSKQNAHKLVVSYGATILEGGLKIDESATRFLTTDPQLQPRNLTVTNLFKVPVAINNVSLLGEALKYFQMKKFKSVVVPPNKSAVLLSISPKENSLKNIKLNSQLVIHTNVSDVLVPVLSYNGKLTKIFPPGFEDLELLDVGLVSSGTVKKIKFGLQNNNPVTVELKSIATNSVSVIPQLLGIHQGNASSFLAQYSFPDLQNSTRIKPSEIAVVEVTVRAPSGEEILLADVTVIGQYEKLVVPIKVSVAHGTLTLKQIVFEDCFPGKICNHPLKVQSTFNRPMTAMSVTSVPPDVRLAFVGNAANAEILPSSTSYIGDLKWDPGKNCGNHCYLGAHNNASGGSLHWIQSDILPPYISDSDGTLLRDKYERFVNLTKGAGPFSWQDILLRLDTNEVREQPFKAKVKLIWPKISNASRIVFPLTQVANTTIQRLKLYNSASQVIIVQLVMEWAYPQAKRLLDSFPQSFRPGCGEDCFNSTSKKFFVLKQVPDSSEPLGILNATLSPGESYEASVAYMPRFPQKSQGLLFIRNNLTMIEVVELQGQAAYAQLKFGNRKPGSDNPLTFEITEKHLRDCSKEKSRKSSPPNLTVKRSFTARNVGELPVFVHGFYINGLECEGYGFSVLNCGAFELAANGTKKIDVAFTPDFTLSKVHRMLTVETSLGIRVNYSLVTTLPPFFLSTCSSVLGRPAWEPLLYYSAVSFMVFLLFCVLAAAFFESDRILKCALTTMARDRTTVPLDLRQIGTGVAKEFAAQNACRKEPDLDRGEKGKQKEEGGGPSWGPSLSGSDKDKDKYDIHNGGTEESKDKDLPSQTPSAPTSVPGKTKKKLKKNNYNNNAEFGAETNQDHVLTRKREKNLSNPSWCSVFSREGEKQKSKSNAYANENETPKQIRNDIESKKEDVRKEDKKQIKPKKNGNKDRCREEEDTSSTTTDSSNETEKEVSDSQAKGGKPDKFRKLIKKGKPNEIKDNYEGDCDEDDFEKERKSIYPKPSTWKLNSKTSKPNNLTDFTINNSWKSSSNENDQQKTVDFTKLRGSKNYNNSLGNHANISSSSSSNNSNNNNNNNNNIFNNVNLGNLKEKKEKNSNKKKCGDKTGAQKVAEILTVHPTSPCWEHRTFSEVVARNDSPLLYSSIVSAKSNSQKYTSPVDSGYMEAGKRCESSVSSILGPIGSKKPASNWSTMAYNSCNQGTFFDSNFAEPPSGFVENNLSPEIRAERSVGSEDCFPLDSETLWEDRNSVAQSMHRQDNHYRPSWKENWSDFWCSNSNRNFQNVNDSLATDDGLTEQSWSSFLRPAWPPSPWSPSAGQIRSADEGVQSARFGNYRSLSDADNGVDGFRNSASRGNVSTRNRFFQNAAPQHPQTLAGEIPATNGLQFDPFHSLSSIWSPKAQNTWNSSGN